MGKEKKASIYSLLFSASTIFLILSLLFFIGLAPLRIISQQNQLDKAAITIKQQFEQNSFSGSRSILQALQNSSELKQALIRPDDCNGSMISLNLAKEVLDASMVYLLDTSGTVLSSTNYTDNKGLSRSLIGNNYSFRPYFQNALKGQNVIYPAVGVTTGKRGIYCSAPVYDTDSISPIGVIVIKLDITKIDSCLYNYTQNIIIVSPENIVFATNQPDWLFGVPESIFDSVKIAIKKSKQFIHHELSSLPYSLSENTIYFNDKENLTSTHNLSTENWKLFAFEEKNPNYPISEILIKIVISVFIIITILTITIFSLIYIIRKKRKAENDLTASKNNLRSILNSIGDGVVAIDNNGYVFRMNPIAEKLTGYSEKEATGKFFSDILLLLDPQTQQPQLELINSIQTGKPNTIDELELISRYRSKKEISILVSPIIDSEGTTHGIVAIFRDISQQKETNIKLQQQFEKTKIALLKAEETDRLKTAFLQNISHEIRTPLNGIVGFSELLSTKNLKESVIKDYKQHIRSNANHLLDVIQDVIEISQLETNQVKIKIETFDMTKLCQSLLEKYQIINKTNPKIKIYLQNDDEIDPVIILNDLSKISKIFYILLDNAFKFTYSGSINFGYHIENEQLHCFVKDTGIGISKEQHKDIFKHFTQVSSKKSISKGVGIGLAIAQKYIMLMGGSIWLESEKGKGACFYFSVPLTL